MLEVRSSIDDLLANPTIILVTNEDIGPGDQVRVTHLVRQAGSGEGAFAMSILRRSQADQDPCHYVMTAPSAALRRRLTIVPLWETPSHERNLRVHRDFIVVALGLT